MTARDRHSRPHRYNRHAVEITLNGESYPLEQPLSVTDLLVRLEIDPRRVAIEHNLAIVRRHLFPDTVVRDGDRVEIVNFVGGG
ncbi:MAG: sulfur carrier protein ThiS [Vicinamibacterales bacterium]|nr:sulfur carrier protein ThiS [Vicinamibacterales bacterium]